MKQEITELRNKILKGIDLAYKTLIQNKTKEDKEVVYSQNGKIVRIKAKDLNK